MGLVVWFLGVTFGFLLCKIYQDTKKAKTTELEKLLGFHNAFISNSINPICEAGHYLLNHIGENETTLSRSQNGTIHMTKKQK